jgi:hypothetical protein
MSTVPSPRWQLSPGTLRGTAIAAVTALVVAVGGWFAWQDHKGPVVSLPAKVEAQPGAMVKIQASTNAGQVWWDCSSGGQLIPLDSEHSCIFDAPKEGVYQVEALVAKSSKIARAHCTILVGQAPPPVPPGPQPPVPPVPPPGPAPIPEAGFRVLVVLPHQAKLPREQLDALLSQEVRQYLDSKCVVGPDGKTKEWRIWDETTNPGNESALWQAAFKRSRQGLPWIVISTGQAGYEGPLPANKDDLLQLLKKYGG